MREVLLQFIATPVFSQHVETGYYLKIRTKNESQMETESALYRQINYSILFEFVLWVVHILDMWMVIWSQNMIFQITESLEIIPQ